MKKQIAVIFGGQSSEHEISCVSAANIIDGLDLEQYDIHKIGITKEGQWLYVEDIKTIRDGSWIRGTITAVISPDRKFQGIWKIKEGKVEVIAVDVIFPVLHGLYGEDGTIQGLFEMSGIPYVGCGVLASAASMDKISTKIFADRIGVRQADYVVDIAKDCSEINKTIMIAEAKLGYPMFVKPSNAGSSQGVSKAHNRDELKRAIEMAKEHDHRVLIEENIDGREIECAVLGGEYVEASKVGEIVSSGEFYDFESKYHDENSKTLVDPEDLSDAVKERVRSNAIAIFKAVSGFGLARVDFFVSESDEVVFNEINTLPGFTDISMYPMLWAATGVPKKELLSRLIELAYIR